MLNEFEEIAGNLFSSSFYCYGVSLEEWILICLSNKCSMFSYIVETVLEAVNRAEIPAFMAHVVWCLFLFVTCPCICHLCFLKKNKFQYKHKQRKMLRLNKNCFGKLNDRRQIFLQEIREDRIRQDLTHISCL